MIETMENLASYTRKCNNIKGFIDFCEEHGKHLSSRFVKRVPDKNLGICIFEKRYLIENCEVIIRTYEKQIKNGVTVDCYVDYGFDIFIFPY